jgi:hypothetical protein
MRVTRQQLLKWCLIFAGWTLFAFFYASQGLFINSYRDKPLVWWRVLTWDLAFCYLWFLLTPVVLRLSRRFSFERGHIIKSLAFHLVAFVLLSLFHLLIYTLLDPILPRFAEPDLVPRTFFFEKYKFFVIGNLHLCFISYCAVLTINYLVRYYRAYRERALRRADAGNKRF